MIAHRVTDRPALLAGFAAEARIARRSGWPVAAGAGTTDGAALAVRRLIDAGATGLVSFGLAGGLDRTLRAGTVIIADAVMVHSLVWRTDPMLTGRLGGSTGHVGLGVDRVIASGAEKIRLGLETGAAFTDMESGAIAVAADAAGLPFAVLRVICDAASSDLPPAALVALDARGRISPFRILGSISRHPGQIGALLDLARDASLANRALKAAAERLRG